MRPRRGTHRKRGGRSGTIGSFQCGSVRAARVPKNVAHRRARHSSLSASSPILTCPTTLHTTNQNVDARPRSYHSVNGRLSSRREDEIGLDESEPRHIETRRIARALRHQRSQSEGMRLGRDRSIAPFCTTRTVLALVLFCSITSC